MKENVDLMSIIIITLVILVVSLLVQNRLWHLVIIEKLIQFRIPKEDHLYGGLFRQLAHVHVCRNFFDYSS